MDLVKQDDGLPAWAEIVTATQGRPLARAPQASIESVLVWIDSRRATIVRLRRTLRGDRARHLGRAAASSFDRKRPARSLDPSRRGRPANRRGEPARAPRAVCRRGGGTAPVRQHHHRRTRDGQGAPGASDPRGGRASSSRPDSHLRAGRQGDRASTRRPPPGPRRRTVGAAPDRRLNGSFAPVASAPRSSDAKRREARHVL